MQRKCTLEKVCNFFVTCILWRNFEEDFAWILRPLPGFSQDCPFHHQATTRRLSRLCTLLLLCLLSQLPETSCAFSFKTQDSEFSLCQNEKADEKAYIFVCREFTTLGSQTRKVDFHVKTFCVQRGVLSHSNRLRFQTVAFTAVIKRRAGSKVLNTF